MSERRYTEDEIAAIFARAADTQEIGRRTASSASGMTLSELQEIGVEAGLSPEAVAQAASQVEQTGRPTSRSFLGLPIGVGKTVELGRRLSDDEWERLVVDLRETFDARGKVSAHGSFRQWTNGNLQALLEPTETGHRLRLKTVKGNARAMLIAGIATLGFAAASLIGPILGGGGVEAGDVGVLALLGISLLGIGAIQLPSWARLRRRQMDDVAARITQVASTQTDELRISDPKHIPNA